MKGRAIITILLLLGWVACCIAQGVDRVRHHYVTSGQSRSTRDDFGELFFTLGSNKLESNVGEATRFLDGTVQMHKDMEKMSSPLARGVSRGGIVLRTSYTALGKGKVASDGCRVIQRLYYYSEAALKSSGTISKMKLFPCDESAVASDNADRIRNGLDDYSLYPPISRRSRSRSKSRRGSNNGSSEILEPKMIRPSDIPKTIKVGQELNHYVISTFDLHKRTIAEELYAIIFRKMVRDNTNRLYQNSNVAKAESDGRVVIRPGPHSVAKALSGAPQYTVYLHTRIESMGETAEAGCMVTQSLHLVECHLVGCSVGDVQLSEMLIHSHPVRPCELDRINLDIRPLLARQANNVDG